MTQGAFVPSIIVHLKGISKFYLYIYYNNWWKKIHIMHLQTIYTLPLLHPYIGGGVRAGHFQPCANNININNENENRGGNTMKYNLITREGSPAITPSQRR